MRPYSLVIRTAGVLSQRYILAPVVTEVVPQPVLAGKTAKAVPDPELQVLQSA